MGIYRFPLSSGVGERASVPDPGSLPPVVSVMYAGEFVCDAYLEQDAYLCELPEEYLAKLESGRIDQVFVYEPPLIGSHAEQGTRRELVSILLVGVARKGSVADD